MRTGKSTGGIGTEKDDRLCGFLSNWEEAKKLQDPGYQNKIAWAVAMGMISYMNQ